MERSKMNDTDEMIARDIEGNEWDARPLTEEELEKLKERKDDYRRDATRSMMLLDDGRSGIAFPAELAGRARNYGGLRHDKSEDIVIIDGERYVAWIDEKMRDAYYEGDYYSRYDFRDTNVWYFYLGPLNDKWWNGEE